MTGEAGPTLLTFKADEVADGGTANLNPPFTTKNVIARVEDKCTMFA